MHVKSWASVRGFRSAVALAICAGLLGCGGSGDAGSTSGGGHGGSGGQGSTSVGGGGSVGHGGGASGGGTTGGGGPGGGGGSGGSGCGVGALLVPDCGAWLGAWSNDHGTSTVLTDQIAEHEARIGRTVDVVHNYHPVGSLPLSPDELVYVNGGRILLTNWKPAAVWRDAAGAMNGGKASVDADIDTVASRIGAVAPHVVMLAVYHEPENDQTSAGGGAGTPADYVAMWHNVRARFDAAGVTNVVWIWDTQLSSKWLGDALSFYPGDDHVDWVMWDPYSFAGTKSYVDTITVGYQWLLDNAGPGHDFPSKPWGLAEWGVFDPSDPGGPFEQQFYADAAASFTTFPRIKAYVIFDSSVTHDTRIDSSPAEQASYDAFAASPYLNQPLTLP